MQRRISTEIKKSPKTSTNYPTTHGSSNFDAACVQPPCVPMVHSRHPHHAWSVIGARNTSSRAPQDQMILWLKHFWAPWLLHKAFPPISCSAKTSFSDRILEAEAKPQSITKLRFDTRRNFFQICRMAQCPRKSLAMCDCSFVIYPWALALALSAQQPVWYPLSTSAPRRQQHQHGSKPGHRQDMVRQCLSNVAFYLIYELHIHVSSVMLLLFFAGSFI